jgi:hypothetical protein
MNVPAMLTTLTGRYAVAIGLCMLLCLTFYDTARQALS